MGRGRGRQGCIDVRNQFGTYWIAIAVNYFEDHLAVND